MNLIQLLRRKQPPEMLLKDPRQVVAFFKHHASTSAADRWALKGVRRERGGEVAL
jgi:hypothetical protein